MILHVYANRSNVGDWLSALGIRTLLPPEEPVEELLCDAPFVPDTLARLAAAGPGDVVVVGGGGLFMDYFAPFWTGLAALDLAAPLVVWGAGYVDLKAEPSRLDPDVLRPLLARAPLVAVRDELTRGILGLPDARVALCPSALAVPPPGPAGRGVLHVAAYTTVGAAAYEAMRAAARAFADATGRPFRETSNCIEAGDRRGLAAVLDLYAGADLVLSSRLHGCILALASRRALVPVSGDRKVEAFLEAVGLGALALDAADLDAIPAAIERAAAAGPPALDLTDTVARENAPVAAALADLLAARAPRRPARRPATASEAAARAWSRVPGALSPTRIEPLGDRARHPRSRAALFRLFGARPGGGDVVAKRGPVEATRIESAVYARVLPALPLPAVRAFGSVEDDADGWLFLEAVAGRPYDPDDPADRRHVAGWLGTLHAGTLGRPPADVPELGLDVYRTKLDDARAWVGAAPAGVDLGGLPALLARVDRAWDDLATQWDALPRCLVHGDFIPKNVLVRTDRSEASPAVLDWERCGFGVPAEDLSGADLDAYVAAAGGAVDRATAEALERLGAVLQAVGWIQSWSAGLASDWVEETASALRACAASLEGAVARAAIGSRAAERR